MTKTCERQVLESRGHQAEDEVDVLGVRFDRLSRASALSIMKRTFGSRRAFKVYISNAHTVNLACADERGKPAPLQHSRDAVTPR